VRVPGGFATTAHGCRCFLAENGLEPRIRSLTESFQKKERSLAEVGKDIRSLFLESRMPDAVAEAVRAAYRRFAEQTGREASDVAVRSSATAEDLPEASERTEDKT
jgi:pyruvate,water dikinase